MIVRPQSIEIAHPKDEEEIFQLLCLLHQENAMFPKDDEKVRFFIKKALNQDGGLMGIIKEKNKIVGCVSLFQDSFWYSNTPYLSEFFNYVHPDYRRSSHAKDMIDFAKWAAQEMGLILLMGIISNIRTKAKLQLYNRKLDFIGGIFVGGMPVTAEFEKIELQDAY